MKKDKPLGISDPLLRAMVLPDVEDEIFSEKGYERNNILSIIRTGSGIKVWRYEDEKTIANRC